MIPNLKELNMPEVVTMSNNAVSSFQIADITFARIGSKWSFSKENYVSKIYDFVIDALQDAQKYLIEAKISNGVKELAELNTAYRLSSIDMMKSFAKITEFIQKDTKHTSMPIMIPISQELAEELKTQIQEIPSIIFGGNA